MTDELPTLPPYPEDPSGPRTDPDIRFGLQVFIGVHSAMGDLLGATIRLATETYCHTPWVMGAKHPASHAYVAWTHGDGIYYRVDAQPGGAEVSLWDGPQRPTEHPSMQWRLCEGQGDIVAAHKKIVDLIGVPYDGFELGAQLFPLLDKLNFVKGAMICTHLATDVLEAFGGPTGPAEKMPAAKRLVAEMPDRFPERLGRALKDAESQGWLKREVQNG